MKSGVLVPDDAARTLLEAGNTIVAIAHAGRCIGLIALADRLRETTPAAIARLRALGIEVVMLTGDNPATAQAIAAAAGIVEFKAGVLPADKAAAVTAIQGRRQSDGHGRRRRQRRAGARRGRCELRDRRRLRGRDRGRRHHLIRNDLNAVVDAILLSRATLAKIRQNLFFAFAYNVLGIPLAAFGLLNPVIAGAAMAASSVSVVGNALLLKRWRPAQ